MLLHGIFYGFYVLRPEQSTDVVPPYEVDNYAREAIDLDALRKKIAAELQQGIIRQLPHRPDHITALFTKHEADKIRPLKDYSAPKGDSVNSYADARKFSMMSLEDAYALLKPAAYMAKVDISDAFRTVGVHPKHRRLLAFKMRDPLTGQDSYYEEARFPMGLKNSPEIFCRLSQAVRAMMAARGIRGVVVYVDDFLIVADTQRECQLALDILLELLQSLGFTISEKKTVLPTQSLTFLGLQLDTNCDGAGGMRVTVPADKMRKARDLAIQLSKQHTVTAAELQHALGYFNHLAQAIFSARVYLRRLIAVLHSAADDNAIPVTNDMRLDLEWWATQAATHNGTAVILHRPVMTSGFFATDASDWGMGGVLGDREFSVSWDKLDEAIHLHIPVRLRKYVKPKARPARDAPSRWWIDYREQFAMFYALLLWNDELRGKHATLHCDNTVAQFTLNKGSATAMPMHALIRRMYAYLAAENIRVRVVRISSEANLLADALSRKQYGLYQSARAAFRPPPAPEAWEPRVFRDRPLMEQAALQWVQQDTTPTTQSPSLPQGGDTEGMDDVLLMIADCPGHDSTEYMALHMALV
jgi:hypothetical protein